MKIELLGCDGAPGPGRFTMSLLVNDRLLIDAGSVASALDYERRQQIENVLISHTHLDHVKELAFLPPGREVDAHGLLGIWATRQSIDVLRRTVFHADVWFDFADQGAVERVTMKYRELAPGERYEVNGISFEAVLLNHGVETMGFILQDTEGIVVIAIDSGPTDEIWARAREAGRVRAVFCDVSLPESMNRRAARNGHLTPSLLRQEIAKMGLPTPRVIACHLKPRFREEIRAELDRLDAAVEVPQSGDTLQV